MKKQERGFTLLEAVVALVLFSILLQSLLNFFGSMYVNAKEFQEKAYYMDNARSVNDFIREKIRENLQVEIDTSGGLILPIAKGDTVSEIVGQLNRINLDASGNTFIKLSELKDGSGNYLPRKGKYKLEYWSGGTPSLISDQIEDIQVKRGANSEIVEFTCEFNKHDETKEILKLEEIFTESLAYKKKF